MRPSRLDAGLAAGTIAGTAAEVLLSAPADPGALIALGVVSGIALLWRGTRPEVPLVVLMIGFLVFAIARVEPDAVALIVAFWVTVFTTGLLLSVRRSLVLYGVVLIALGAELLTGGTVADVFFTAVVFVVPPFLLGRLMRDRQNQIAALERANRELERERDTAATLAAETERARIAHDLHDGLSHGLGVLSLQAAAGERLAIRDVDGARAALAAIREAAASAASELSIAETPAGLTSVCELVAGVRATGVVTRLEETGNGSVPPGVQVAAHRIVQEALTNALRHGTPAQVDVRVHRGPAAIEVSVEHDGEGEDARAGVGSPGSGRGLAGMRQRVLVHGGELDAGPVAGGGFRVFARLPTAAT